MPTNEIAHIKHYRIFEVLQTLNLRYRMRLFGREDRKRLPSESNHPISPAQRHTNSNCWDVRTFCILLALLYWLEFYELYYK